MQRWPAETQDDAGATDALAEGQAVQQRAVSLGFDWPDIAPVWDKLEEELAELQAAARSGKTGEIQHELGDVLFSVVNLARFLGVDAQQTMQLANARFNSRLSGVQRLLDQSGRRWDQCTLQELEALWQQVKREG